MNKKFGTTLYHNHHSLHGEDLDFWLGLATQQGNPILELACGTGRLTIPLVEAGFDLTGLDHDAEMLAFLKGRITPELSQRVVLVQADVTNYHLARQFSLIYLACNTYSTLEAGARGRTLSLAREHLLPDGIFAASIPNPLGLAGLPASGEPEVEEIFTHPQSRNPVQVSSEYSKDCEWYRLRWHYDHLIPDGRVERTTIETQHSLASVEEYLTEVERAGLHTAEIYGDYDRSKFGLDSPYLILCLKLA